jgi:AraC family transcriptional activator of tynA and feaB
MVTHTTDAVPPGQRIAFWRDGVMRRLAPIADVDGAAAFRARLNLIQGDGAEMVDVVSHGWRAERDAGRCRRDGYDDLSFDLLVSGRLSVAYGSNAPRRRRINELTLLDTAQPLETIRARHRNISLLIARDSIPKPAACLPRFPERLQPHGLVPLLKSQLRITADMAVVLSPEERVLAMRIATDLAMAALQSEAQGRFDPEQFPLGLFEGAKMLIARKCTDPEFGPAQIVTALGCSRAALYRAFAAHGLSVAAAIWAARTEHASDMLASTPHAGLTIGEVAFRSGFVDHPTFNRMFKRRYSVTPQEARHRHQAMAAAS